MKAFVLQEPENYCYILLLVSIMVLSSIEGQQKEISSDTLSMQRQGSKTVRQLPSEFLKGIAASNYKKDSKIEYFPLTSLELPSIPLTEMKIRPRLITEPQIRRAQQKIFREPFRSWYQLLKEQTDRYILEGDPVLNRPVFRIAEDIKALAFIYRIEGDIRYLEAAEKLLAQLPEPPKVVNLEGGSNGQGWGDFLESAQAMPAICVALDLLYQDLEKLVRDNTRRILSELSQQLLDALLYTTGNNHMTVMGIAILTVAIIEDQPELFITLSRNDIWQQGLQYLSRALGLISPDGGYAEGVYYGNYISNYLSPFSMYFLNLTGLKLFEHPYLERMINWLIANDKGTGRYTGFDDAFQASFFFLPVIIPQSRQKRDWYAYWQRQPPLEEPKANLTEAIVIFETMMNISQTSAPGVQFFEEHGQVIFRDRALEPQIFATFLSEREFWFASRHEHIDPFNFELSAFGEDLIVDAGYGRGTNDVNRNWYLSAQAHNGILIDGLGTYQNPIWGDPIASKPTHTFQTGQSAAMTMNHFLGDLSVRRKVYFIRNRYLIMVDQIKSSRPHSVALNFNHLGTMRQASPNHVIIQNNQTALNLFSLSSQDIPATITQNFGLYTPPGTPQPIRTFQIEQPSVADGNFMTMLYPLASSTGTMLSSFTAVQGTGEVLTMRDPGGLSGTFEIGINRGIGLKTARWRSNSRNIWISYDENSQIDGLLLVNFSDFQSDQLNIQTDFPATLYLEFQAHHWQGYIEAGNKNQYRLTISGIQEFPLRFNRLPVTPEKAQGDTRQYLLTGSGTLEIGSGVRPVMVPYRFHQAPDLVSWLNRQPAPRRQYEYWPDYYKATFNNQLTEYVRRSLELGIEYWSSQAFNDSLTIKHAVYAASGVLQESYNRDSRTTFSISLPHRYQFQGSAGDVSWSIFEEGSFTANRVNIRNIAFGAELPGGSGMQYRGGNWFTDHQLHQIRFYDAAGSQFLYQRANLGEIRNELVQLQFRRNNFWINPGYSRTGGGGIENAFVNWRSGKFQGSLRSARQADTRQYYQNFNGYGRQWAFSAEGRQNNVDNTQNYTASWLYHFSSQLSILQGGSLEKMQVWDLPNAYTEVNWSRRSIRLRARLERFDQNLHQLLAMYWHTRSSSISGSITLADFRFQKSNIFRARINHRTAGKLQFYTNMTYRFRQESHAYQMDLYHSLQIPVGRDHYWLPIIGEILPSNDPLQWIGSGFSYNGGQPIWGQVLVNRAVRPIVVDYQFATNLLNRQRRPYLSIWGRLEQRQNQFYSGEISLQPLFSPLQPGIYYSYLKGGGSRLEGFLQWRW